MGTSVASRIARLQKLIPSPRPEDGFLGIEHHIGSISTLYGGNVPVREAHARFPGWYYLRTWYDVNGDGELHFLTEEGFRVHQAKRCELMKEALKWHTLQGQGRGHDVERPMGVVFQRITIEGPEDEKKPLEGEDRQLYPYGYFEAEKSDGRIKEQT